MACEIDMLKVASVVEAVKCLEEFKKLVQVMIEFSFWLNDFIRRLLENYCFVPLANKAPPQISDNRPDMRHRALFVTSRAAWRWNKMLLARENVDRPLAAMVLATEHNAL